LRCGSQETLDRWKVAALMAQDRISEPAAQAGSATVAPVPPPGSERASIEGNKGRRFVLTRLAAGPWPLMCVLVVQALLSLRLVWSNTAFQDEALYLWAGHLEWAHWLHGGSVPDFPAYFSGAPVVYPPLGALASSIGGLAGARILSLCFMLAATALLYSVTKRLFGRGAAIAGSAIFAVLGPVQFLGAFATFDALAVLLLALSSWLAVRSGGHRGELWLAGCAVAMALADAAKYTSLLWNLVVIALAVLGSAGAWQLAVSRGIRLATYTAVLIIPVLFLAGGHGYVTGIMSTTLARPSSTVPALRVLYASGKWIGVVALLAIIGAAAMTRQRVMRLTAIAWILTAAVFLAPAEQARIHTIFSLFKHVGFGAWFACIVAGYGLTTLARVAGAVEFRNPSVVLVFLLGVYGSVLSASQFAGWPDSSQMIRDIAPVIERTGCPCLVAESDVVDYYLVKQTTHDIFTTIFVMRYWDDGRELSGTPAYRAAIRNHYFRLVEIDPAELPAMYAPVVQALSASHYRLVASTPSNVPGEPFEIWIRYGAR
jgi:Dolichyl-phosphate-mannose-protein mannosyltransferase